MPSQQAHGDSGKEKPLFNGMNPLAETCSARGSNLLGGGVTEKRKKEVVVPCLSFYLSLWGTSHDALSTSSLFLFALLMCIYAATHINKSVYSLL